MENGFSHILDVATVNQLTSLFLCMYTIGIYLFIHDSVSSW